MNINWGIFFRREDVQVNFIVLQYKILINGFKKYALIKTQLEQHLLSGRNFLVE